MLTNNTIRVLCDAMMTVADIIEAFGGPTSLGDAIDARPQAVVNMRARESIPSRYWPALVRVAAERDIDGITLEALADMAVRRAARRGAA